MINSINFNRMTVKNETKSQKQQSIFARNAQCDCVSFGMPVIDKATSEQAKKSLSPEGKEITKQNRKIGLEERYLIGRRLEQHSEEEAIKAIKSLTKEQAVFALIDEKGFVDLPIHAAAYSNCPEAIKAMGEKLDSVDLAKMLLTCDRSGDWPIYLAGGNYNSEATKAIIDLVKGKDDKTLYKMLIKRDQDDTLLKHLDDPKMAQIEDAVCYLITESKAVSVQEANKLLDEIREQGTVTEKLKVAEEALKLHSRKLQNQEISS
jgi:hypothetical protein